MKGIHTNDIKGKTYFHMFFISNQGLFIDMARNCLTSVSVDVVFLNAMTTVSHKKEHSQAPESENAFRAH